MDQVNRVDCHAKKITVNSWSDLQAQFDTYVEKPPIIPWAFRGAGNADWTLQSSLERLKIGPAVQAERYLLTTFQRRVHHYIPDPPAKDDDLEWLALLQHHGAPTRLQDWTKSPYVALFFALDGRREEGEYCAIWAINLLWCKQQAIDRIMIGQNLVIEPDESLAKPETFRNVFLTEPPVLPLKFVAPLQPFRMNERLTIQQGLFLCPGDLNTSFESNLLEYQKNTFEGNVHKIVIPKKLRLDILSRLNRWNINRASLFPGIDGFAQSLITNVEIATGRGTFASEVTKLSIYSEWGFL